MILDMMVRQRRFFDETSKNDIAAAKHFFTNHSWGTEGCPFILEYPYMSIPDMIKDKVIHKALGIPYDRRHHFLG